MNDNIPYPQNEEHREARAFARALVFAKRCYDWAAVENYPKLCREADAIVASPELFPIERRGYIDLMCDAIRATGDGRTFDELEVAISQAWARSQNVTA